jgi:hypothetical protein
MSLPTVDNSSHSGVGTYTNFPYAHPLDAEEGLIGSIRPPNLKGRVSNIYPRAYDLEGELFTDEKEMICIRPWSPIPLS